jgi:polyhydroxyalkanoate synthesis regulator phasin
MANEQKGRGGIGGIGDGIRTGIGVLNAFKEAIEETLQEAVDRGDLTPERAKRAMKDAAQRVQGAFEETREKMDFATRQEVEELRAEVTALRERLGELERRGNGPGDTPPDPAGIIITE